MSELLDDPLFSGTQLERLIQPYLLLLLGQKPSHGYELIQRLNEANFTGGDFEPATVYRNLRRMDKDGLVKSRWQAGPAGPARRLYVLTPRGRELLEAWVLEIRRQKEKIEHFLQAHQQYLEGLNAKPAKD